MGGTFSLVAPVSLNTNVGEIDVKSNIESNIKSDINLTHLSSSSSSSPNEIGTLVSCQTFFLKITDESARNIPLPKASKLSGCNYKIINETSTEKILNLHEGDNIRKVNTFGINNNYKLYPKMYLSIISDGISSWLIE
jgi:hypothetical protein